MPRAGTVRVRTRTPRGDADLRPGTRPGCGFPRRAPRFGEFLHIPARRAPVQNVKNLSSVLYTYGS
ncbi:hypothetical protein GCM10010358_69590 [Streptomyces minutiscleroticus]|uniref:Uncharacterized protein n=1 Tax=Streptomyces minutiscleroticus TaxID=68238 RepID=A0A918NZ66_9ACTN|nr:hypothetical protein GCM10010358_69590 [Streptomyces minutiscleroticus]